MVKVSILVLLQKTESIKRNGLLVNFFRKAYPAAYLLGYQNTNAICINIAVYPKKIIVGNKNCSLSEFDRLYTYENVNM